MSALHQRVGTLTQWRGFNATLVGVLIGALVGCGGGGDTTPVMGDAANGQSTFGVEIEDLDIRDTTAQLTDIDNADILMVYDHLLRGSRNHLRAYMTLLTQQGGTYVPQYISQTEFDAIVNSAIEPGR